MKAKRKILISIGTRPNTIKITQFKQLARSYNDLDLRILHTGQHYDQMMSQVFFDQFEFQPDYQISLKRASPLSQSIEIMASVGEVLDSFKPDILLTPGDVNSTFAAAYAAYKKGVKVGHIESGLRSFDRAMPEEINRRMTDQISDFHFITEPSGQENLLNEGISAKSQYFVGNTMIDSLVAFEDQIDASNILELLKVEKNAYYLLTFHRPSNVDSIDSQRELIEMIEMLAQLKTCVFPIHPRTKMALIENGFYAELESISNLILTPPLAYFEFQKVVKNSRIVITDSGGIQEETTFQRIPCITLRTSTERPVTVDVGTNVLLEFDSVAVEEECKRIEASVNLKGQIPELWDGKSSKRILELLMA